MATRWDRTPGLTDDVVKRSAEDVQKVRKGINVDSSDLKGGARQAVREAGSRAASRLAGRAGAAGAALQGGYELGREIDERTGLGKRMVEESGLGGMAERMVNRRDKVELTKEAQNRIAKGELEEKRKETAKRTRSEEPSIDIKGKYRPGRNEEIDDETRENAGGYKRGGVVKKTASSRADGIAKRGKTRGVMVACGGGYMKGKK